MNSSSSPHWQEVTKSSPCSACGKPNWCSRAADGAIACRRCDDSAGVPLVDKNGDGYVLVPAEAAGSGDVLPLLDVRSAPEPASIYLRDRAYQRMSRELALESTQAKGLAERGLSAGAIEFHGFVSGPLDGNHRQRLGREVARMLPTDWQSIPGFFESSSGEPTLGGSSGTWIPCRNLQGQVQGWKIRKDAVEKGESRYRTLTSSHRGGPGAGQMCSYWMPSSGHPTADVVRVCEGELKACVAAERTNVEGFAAPGVSALASTTLLDWIHSKKPAQVLLAPDRDAFTNASVGEHTMRAVETYLADARTCGYEAIIESWDGPNGIDDALLAGAEIMREPAIVYLARLRSSRAAVSSPEQTESLPLLEHALQALAGACDGAQARDAQGFSKVDREWFAPHLACLKKGKKLSLRVRKRCLERLSKYGHQLFAMGLNINDVAYAEDELREAARAELEDEGLTQVDKLLALANVDLETRLIKSAGQVYAVMKVRLDGGGSRKECHRFGREGVRMQLLRAYRRKYNAVPSSEALTSATEALKADATIDGVEESVWIRTAQHNGKIYLDLANPAGDVVEVSSGSWKVVTDPPVNFLRPNGMLPIPMPTSGSSLLELRPYVNLDDTGWRIVVSWLLFSLFPLRPHPVLLLEGEQGSSKSCLARMLRSLVDPHTSPLRKVAKSAEDGAVMAGSNWFFCLDNLASIPPWLSDFLCGLATGSGSSTRKLFTDDDEHTINYLRPVLLTGIGGLHGKADLGDRVLKVTLNPIEGAARIAEEVFEKRIEELRPRMLGALLDVAAVALRNKDNVPLPALPRLADFAKTIIEAEEALPWESGDFLAAFDEARQEQIEAAIEGDPLAQALRDLALTQAHWEGSATDLVTRLNKLKGDSRHLPPANKLQVHLRLLAPSLRAVGVLVTFHKTNGRRLVKVSSEIRPGVNARPETLPTYVLTPPLQQCVFSGMVADYRAPQGFSRKPPVQDEREALPASPLVALTG
jgi:hypothetical protein